MSSAFLLGWVMSKRACVFVDGENFRHTIIDLFEDFDKTEYLPKTAKWSDLFDWFVTRVAGGAERVRTKKLSQNGP